MSLPSWLAIYWPVLLIVAGLAALVMSFRRPRVGAASPTGATLSAAPAKADDLRPPAANVSDVTLPIKGPSVAPVLPAGVAPEEAQAGTLPTAPAPAPADVDIYEYLKNQPAPGAGGSEGQ